MSIGNTSGTRARTAAESNQSLKTTIIVTVTGHAVTTALQLAGLNRNFSNYAAAVSVQRMCPCRRLLKMTRSRCLLTRESFRSESERCLIVPKLPAKIRRGTCVSATFRRILSTH